MLLIRGRQNVDVYHCSVSSVMQVEDDVPWPGVEPGSPEFAIQDSTVELPGSVDRGVMIDLGPQNGCSNDERETLGTSWRDLIMR